MKVDLEAVAGLRLGRQKLFWTRPFQRCMNNSRTIKCVSRSVDELRHVSLRVPLNCQSGPCARAHAGVQINFRDYASTGKQGLVDR